MFTLGERAVDSSTKAPPSHGGFLQIRRKKVYASEDVNREKEKTMN